MPKKIRYWIFCTALVLVMLADSFPNVVRATEISENSLPAEDGQAKKTRVTVVIDAGHGGDPEVQESNGGAYYNDIYEKDLNLTVANAMREELEQYKGVDVFMTRQEDVELGLDERAAFAAEKGADVLIGIHFNASQAHLFYGSEVWTSMFGKYYATGYGFGTCFLEQFENMGLLNRGIKTRKGSSDLDYYGLIRHGVEEDIPTIIVEHCYVDDPEDYTYADSQMDLIAFGKSDAAAVAQYYGLSKDTEPQDIQPTVQIPVLEAPILPDDTAPESVTLTLVEYDEETGAAEFVLSAVEEESKLLYYGYSTDGGKNYSKLEVWTGTDGKCQIQIPVGKRFTGTIQAVVYNNFNSEAYSNTVRIKGQDGEERSSKDEVTYDLDDVYDIPSQEMITVEPEDDTPVQVASPSVYERILIVLILIFVVLLGVFVGLLIVVSIQKNRRK